MGLLRGQETRRLPLQSQLEVEMNVGLWWGGVAKAEAVNQARRSWSVERDGSLGRRLGKGRTSFLQEVLQCLMASHLALVLLLTLARVLSQPDLCEYETNRIKDLLQASCEGKGLTKVPPGLDTDTGILLLSSNQLAQVSTASFKHLRNLTDLDLSRNGMGRLETTSPLPRLQELDLSHNVLKELPSLQGFPNLVRLALGHNALSWVPKGGFRALGELVDLELQGNQLQSLPEEAFAGLVALKDLDLSDNRLRLLPPELLAELGALETLRLERNRLRSVPEGFFPEGHLFAYVYLVGNPWLCDCALEYLRDWINENSFAVYTRVQGPEKEITENQPENVTCHDPPEELGRPVMDFDLDCTPESQRGIRGDGEELFEPPADPSPTTSGPDTSPDVLSTSAFPVTTTAFFTQPEPSPPTPSTLSVPTSKATPLAHSPTTASPPSPSPTTLGSLATTHPTVRSLPTVPTTSTLGLPPASTTATPLEHSSITAASSPSPTTLGSLATTLSTAKGVQAGPATSTVGLPPASTTAPAGTTSSPSPQAMNTTQATPAPTNMSPALPTTTHPGFTVHPPTPPPPAYCQCPMLPGVALGLTGQRPSPVSWRAWLAVHCCPLRLVLYVGCLVLVFLPTLALLCWGVCACKGTRHPRATQRAPKTQLFGDQPLQNVAHERCRTSGEWPQPLPTRRLYRVCKRLEIGPLRYVTWLLVSLPGPSGQWPWERKGSFPPYSLDQEEDALGTVQAKCATGTV